MIEVLQKIITLLGEFNIPYVLIGGLAVSTYAEPRATEDIDLLVLISRDRVPDFVVNLGEQGYEVKHRKADFLDPVGDVIHLVINGVPVDLLLARFSYEAEFINRAVPVNFGDFEVRMVDLTDLVLLKLKAGSPKDLFDVVNLVNANRDKIDQESLYQRCKELKIDTKKITAVLEKFI